MFNEMSVNELGHVNGGISFGQGMQIVAGAIGIIGGLGLAKKTGGASLTLAVGGALIIGNVLFG